MVRRGSTVRVRQRALQRPRKPQLTLSVVLAESAACGRDGALYGAFRLGNWFDCRVYRAGFELRPPCWMTAPAGLTLAAGLPSLLPRCPQSRAEHAGSG